MKLFIAGDVSIDLASIRKVVLLESVFSCIKGHDAIPARVVVNESYIFAGREGLDALNKLHDCGYFEYAQYDHMRGRYQKLLDTYELASEGKIPVVA